tara:strand:+ start:36391 stop:37038 length:648 start_codon:yes stop_codon:yes gene_type:complete
MVDYKKVGETHKAQLRRLREGWFDKYAPEAKTGLDIGCGHDCLNNSFRKFDQQFGDGDAQFLEEVENNSYHTVYASHILEHMVDPVKAISRWYEVVEPGGHLIICVPHRHLYERKNELPSRWNQDHKHYFLPETEEPPCTLSFKKVILEAIPGADIVEFRTLNEGYENGLEWYQVEATPSPDAPEGTKPISDLVSVQAHPKGEYSLEAIILKKRV